LFCLEIEKRRRKQKTQTNPKTQKPKPSPNLLSGPNSPSLPSTRPSQACSRAPSLLGRLHPHTLVRPSPPSAAQPLPSHGPLLLPLPRPSHTGPALRVPLVAPRSARIARASLPSPLARAHASVVDPVAQRPLAPLRGARHHCHPIADRPDPPVIPHLRLPRANYQPDPRRDHRAASALDTHAEAGPSLLKRALALSRTPPLHAALPA